MRTRHSGHTRFWWYSRRLRIVKDTYIQPVYGRTFSGVESKTGGGEVFYISMRKCQLKKALERAVRMLNESV